MKRRRLRNPYGRDPISAYFIILLVLLLALAPLWHFAPSKRQKHQARLRQAAALAGLFVEFRDLPLKQEHRERLGASERQVLYYGCRLPPSRRKPRQNASWVRSDDEWQAFPGRLSPPPWVHELPPAVLAIGVSEQSCGLYWREEGDEEDVQKMAAILIAWRDDLV